MKHTEKDKGFWLDHRLVVAAAVKKLFRLRSPMGGGASNRTRFVGVLGQPRREQK